jgi:2,3-bisphosphoglycerate-dependent phosphoglycerate mutase
MSTRVLYVRHAKPVKPGTMGFTELARPLDEQGVEDVLELTKRFDGFEIHAVYSSPSWRAAQTVTPLAALRGLEVHVLQDLRERHLRDEPFATAEDHLEAVRRSWTDFDWHLARGESNRVAQARGVRVLRQILERHPDQTVVLGGHGQLMALTANAFDARVDFDFWRALSMPAVLEFIFEGDQVRVSQNVVALKG